MHTAACLHRHMLIVLLYGVSGTCGCIIKSVEYVVCLRNTANRRVLPCLWQLACVVMCQLDVLCLLAVTQPVMCADS